MLEMVKGCVTPAPELLCEQYETDGGTMTANVNAGKIESVFRDFINMQDERVFFILEIPTNEKIEKTLRKDNASPFHKDVYYIDGLEPRHAGVIMSRYGELLINDGMSSFGFGVHDGSAEIMLYQYNVVTLMSRTEGKYDGFFERHGIPPAEKCITAWDTFDYDNPGVCSTVNVNGVSVYDLPELLKDGGIYFAERREQ